MLTTKARNPILVLALFLSLALTTLATPALAAETITVSAAASLTDALAELTKGFEASTGIRVQVNLGSSGALRQQIEHGAPVDVFLSASEGQMQALVDVGLVDADQVQIFATNAVVLIRSPYADAIGALDDLLTREVRYVAIGNPEHVPAGQYGQTALESLGLWQDLQEKLVLGEDVRQVLSYVESGGADAGLVYSTDAATSSDVVVVAQAPVGSHDPVAYPAAVIRDSKNANEAVTFIAYLLSADGREVLNRYGFGNLEDD